MGSVVSLPILSYFALPAVTSYSTSFNLLLFAINWYILLLTHPPLQVELIGIALVRILFYLLPSLIFLAFDGLLPSLAVALKAQGDLALPRRKNRKKQGQIIFWSIFNLVLSIAIQAGLELLLTKVLLLRSSLSLSKRMPTPYHILKSMAILLVARGSLQYLIHRFVLHNTRSPITQTFARMHILWQHSVPAPYSLIPFYDHPVAYLFHHFLPLYMPAWLLRTHLLPFLFTLAIVSLEECVTYSGYAYIPSILILPGMARRVDNHFLAKGEGNFASFGLLDWISGTSVANEFADDMKAEWAKRNEDGKVVDMVDSAQGVVGEKLKKGGRRRKGSGKS